jgi:uncharacterized protein
MKKLFLMPMLAWSLALSGYCTAQGPSAAVPDTDIPDKADVLKFLDLMHARDQMVQTLDQMAKQMKQGAEQGFKEKVPDATPELLAKVDQLFDGLFKGLPIDEMMDAIVPIYQKHLTKSDLAAITAFYSSPAGQKVLKEMPAILAESMQAGGDIGRRAFESKSHEFESKVDELIEQGKADKN